MNKEIELEDVLEGYAAETPEGNDPAILEEWMARHPQYADDLLAFAADRSRARHMPDPDMTRDEMSEAVSRGYAALEIFRESSKKKPSEISSLISSAEMAGLDRSAFARAVGLSVSLLIYLEKRRVRAASVPAKVINSIAAAIGASSEAVRAYLSLPETAAGLNYKAQDRPADVQPKNFAEAVEQDQTLTPEEKKALLSDTD